MVFIKYANASCVTGRKFGTAVFVFFEDTGKTKRVGYGQSMILLKNSIPKQRVGTSIRAVNGAVC